MQLNTAVSLWMDHLEVRQLATASLDGARWALERLCADYGDDDVDSIDAVTLVRWLRELRRLDGQPYAVATISSITSQIKMFWRWASDEGLAVKNVASKLKRRKYPASSRVAPWKDLQTLLASLPALASRGPTWLRDALAVRLVADSSARLGEIYNLRRLALLQSLHEPHITAGIKIYMVRSTGKTGPVVLRFTDQTANYARLWLDAVAGAEYVFSNPDSGARYSYATVKRAFKRLGRAAGVEEFGPHAIRHLNITRLLREKHDPKLVATVANHSGPRVTLDVYRHVATQEVDAVVASLALQRQQISDDVLDKLFKRSD